MYVTQTTKNIVVGICLCMKMVTAASLQTEVNRQGDYFLSTVQVTLIMKPVN